MDFPEPGIAFACCANSFVEDWSGTGQNVRRGEFGDGWIRHGVNGWASLSAATFDVNASQTGNGPYVNAVDGGVQQNTWYMQSGGNTAKTTSSGTVLSVAVTGSAPAIPLGVIVLTSAGYDPVAQAVSVAWAADPGKAPPFGYSVQVFDGSAASGAPLASVTDLAPETRSLSIPVSPSSTGTYTVKISITDIFDRLEVPVTATFPATGSPTPGNPSGILAFDNFQIPPYAPGGLGGQATGGFGFIGTWSQFLGQDLIVAASGSISLPTTVSAPGGDYAIFSNPISLSAGQLYISFDITGEIGSGITTRLDLNADATPVAGNRVLLGGLGVNANFNMTLEAGLGTASTAQTQIPSVGSHHIVGVLDASNRRIGIFVDPTAQSRWDGSGGNANAVASWTPSSGLTFRSYSLVENDHATFSSVAFSTDSSVLTQNITRVPSTISIASSSNPSDLGQSLTLTAVVSPSTATGTVVFRDGSTTLGTATLTGGWATLTVANLSSGAHALTATYSGAPTIATAASAVLNQIIDGTTISALVSTASYQPGFAAMSFVSAFGSFPGVSAQGNQTVPAATSLGGVQVLVNRTSAPLMYVSSTQINFLTPANTPNGPAQVVIAGPEGTSAPSTINIATYAPALFAWTDGKPIIQYPDSSLGKTVHPGGEITLYGTAFGPVTNTPADGDVALGAPNLAMVTGNFTITVGGVNCPIDYLGLGPGEVAVYQINLFIPSNVPTGGQTLAVYVNGASQPLYTNQLTVQ